MPLTLYAVSDGPPSLAVRQALKYLELQHDLVSVDFGRGDHMTEDYAQKNPQKEIPVLDDNGFFLSERYMQTKVKKSLLLTKLLTLPYVSLTKLTSLQKDHPLKMLTGVSKAYFGRSASGVICGRFFPTFTTKSEYLAEKYVKDEYLYPKDPQSRAIVNHRLCFNLSTYYRYISEHVMAPIFFDYQRTPLSLKKTNIALDNFNMYLQRSGTKFAAGNRVTIADFQLVTATMCLEAINFDLSPYPLVKKWYENYKKAYPHLWQIVETGMKEIAEFEKNPPDLSNMDHPIHPVRKN